MTAVRSGEARPSLLRRQSIREKYADGMFLRTRSRCLDELKG
jgi:hypothetical protein